MNLVFDFGGVLFRWQPACLLARVWPARAHNPEVAKALAQRFFADPGGDWHLFDRGLIDSETVTARIAARTGWSSEEVAQVLRAVPDELQLLPETLHLLKDLRRAGHRCFFLSNMPAPYADRLEASHPLRTWFEAGLFSGRAKLAKPSPEAFAAAAACFGIVPQDCLLLDDHPANVEAARQVGWQALLFTDAVSARVQLRARGLLV